MLTVTTTKDKIKLAKQIEALKEVLETDIPDKDRQIFSDTIKMFEEALNK